MGEDERTLPVPYKGNEALNEKINHMKTSIEELKSASNNNVIKPLYGDPFKLPDDDDSGQGLELGGKRRKTRRGKRSRKTKKRKQKKAKQSRRRRRSKK
jgi:hypothetical protein